MRICSGIFIILVVLAAVSIAVAPCTVFSFVSEGGIWFGNSEDHDDDPFIWFLEPRRGVHGVLCLGFGYGAMQGGMNDVGLCYDATGGTSHVLNWHKELPQPPGNWPTQVLQQCETVDDVEAYIRRYDYSSKGMAQFLYLDRNGDSLVVTSTRDGELAFLRQSGGHRVITNFNVTNRWVGTYPCWRYDIADAALRRLAVPSASPSIATFRAVLSGVCIPGYTAYSNVFDVANRMAYVYRAGDFDDVRIIDLAAVFAEGPPGPMTLAEFWQTD